MSNLFACKLCGSDNTSAPMAVLSLGICRDCATLIVKTCANSGIVARPAVFARETKTVIPQGLRSSVFIRDGHRCVQCGSQHVLQADHVIPESKGGPTTLDNLQTLCRRCNTSKGARAA